MAAKSKPSKTLPKTDLSPKLSHYDAAGRATMVDVSGKLPTERSAEASARVIMSPQVLAALSNNPKGNPFEVARFAGIQAANAHRS
jgi:cyclic pyranopterin phosphate synthase